MIFLRELTIVFSHLLTIIAQIAKDFLKQSLKYRPPKITLYQALILFIDKTAIYQVKSVGETSLFNIATS